MIRGAPEKGIETAADWTRLSVGLAVAFGMFHWSATRLGSDRGQAGLLVCAIVLATIVVAERILFGRRLAAALRTAGLTAPDRVGFTAGLVASVIIVLGILPYAVVTGSEVSVSAGSYWLLPGLFAQAGIAEEALFRGYLFGRIRVGRSFWRAACLATVPFAAVHLLILVTQPLPVAVAAILLSIVLSFPLAWLYERGGRSIWGPALLHFVVQGIVKIVIVGNDVVAFALFWMVWAAVSSMLVFVVRPRPSAAAVPEHT